MCKYLICSAWFILPFALGAQSPLKVAVCSEGYPPYVIVNNSGVSGYEIGESQRQESKLQPNVKDKYCYGILSHPYILIQISGRSFMNG